MAYLKLFYEIKDIETIKYICSENPFVEKVGEGDEEFIPFIIAHSYIQRPQVPHKICGYLKMHELFSDLAYLNKVENKFGFGIKEFRECYSIPYIDEVKAKDLKLPQLIFLCFRQLWWILTLKSLRRYLKNKDYTL